VEAGIFGKLLSGAKAHIDLRAGLTDDGKLVFGSSNAALPIPPWRQIKQTASD